VRVGGPRSLGVMVIRYHPKLEDIIVAGTSDGNVLIQSEMSCKLLVNGKYRISEICFHIVKSNSLIVNTCRAQK